MLCLPVLLLMLLLALCPAASSLPPGVIHLDEIWRVGGEQGDLLFGAVTEAASDTEGNVYLLDTQLCHVQVISPEGNHIRTISREGDGPGEVRRPRDVLLLPDQTIGLLELFPAKLVKLSLEGEPRGVVTIGGNRAAEAGGFTAASRCVYRGGTFLLAGQHTAQSESGQCRVQFLARISEAGEERVRYREATMTLDFRKLCFVERDLQPAFNNANAVGPDGRVYAAQAWDRYAIDVFRPDGERERVIEREFENRPRTEDELKRIHALFDASDRNIPYEVTREIESAPPVITSLRVDDQGILWVEHSRSSEAGPAGAMVTYDLFDAEGRYLRAVSIVCEGDPESDGLEFLSDGRVLLIKGYGLAGMARTDLGSVALGEEEETPPLEVICCRMRTG